MKAPDRKSATTAWKERKRNAGIYAVRCVAAGATWVGSAPDLGAIQNRIWFTLKHGGHRDAALKAAHAAHGEAGLAFEILETIEDEDDAYIRGKVLGARARHWCEALGAAAI
ncbi:MAG: GIY-YIG nuclease family protein [Sandarakinorhabdus sp.]|nr:GIY-YIG nuclease family protein [Sandarakinorhabdus sp.]